VVAPVFASSPAANDAVIGLEDDEHGSRVVREELQLFAVVKRALDGAGAAGAEGGRSRGYDDARLLELRDEVAVAKPEDLPSLFEQMHTLGALRAQRGKGATGRVDASSPYFGHLRLEERGKRRDVLIGARSCIDGGAGIRIVDWRNAPVSRIYYRYQEGDEYEEELGDRLIEGRVLARRSVAIVRGELVRVSALQGTFVRSGTGAWQRLDASRARLVTERRWNRDGAGAASAGGQEKLLPAIASMLDGAQFELIARPSTGLVAVQGSAGSGKTTVGLHRVAYLAFADPKRFRPDRILVVVPHDALVHYVGRVLPSLGLEGVLVVTFAQYATGRLQALLPKLPAALSDETPPVVSRAKSHPAMLRAIDRAASRVGETLDAWVREHMPRWPGGADVIRAWDATAGEGSRAVRITPDERVTALARWLTGKTALAGAPLADGLPDVTKGAIERLGHELRRKSRDVIGLWDELLTFRDRLAEAFAGELDFGPGQLYLVHEWCVRRARVRVEGERDGETPALDSEDVALLLRIWQVLRGPIVDDEGRAIRYAHMFVDEVQDASPIELKVLLDLVTKEQSVTLAGDIAQRMFAGGDERGEFDWSRTLQALGLGAENAPHAVEALRVSYRSTAEITTFARGVLGPLAHDAEPIATRHGPPVELFTFASIGESVAWLADALRQLAADEPEANVALVSRFSEHADAYFDGLSRADVPRVRRISRQDFSWAPGFDVTDVRQTKGLEFDEVVLLETTVASYPESLPARHALYVGATRAAHQLWCIASQAPSPLVTSALEGPTGATGATGAVVES
jgi:DNA helicase-2/ATP-dependent DNA helicase PcrA